MQIIVLCFTDVETLLLSLCGGAWVKVCLGRAN